MKLLRSSSLDTMSDRSDKVKLVDDFKNNLHSVVNWGKG